MKATVSSRSRQGRNNRSKKQQEKGEDDRDGKKPKVKFLNRLGFRHLSRDHREIRETEESHQRAAAAAAVAAEVAAAEGTSSSESSERAKQQRPSSRRERQRFDVTTVEDLEAYFADEARRFRKSATPDDEEGVEGEGDGGGEIDYDALLRSLRVVGDTQVIGSADHPEYTHPVARLLHERARTGSQPVPGEGVRSDGCRVALAIEGGGMRGCVSAGMAVAIHYLNLTSSFDAFYGSSAGSIVGAYILTGQAPYFGPEVYYDRLTTAGSQFIDTRRILRALGFGLLDPRLLKDVLLRPSNGKPVLNLPFLLQKTVQGTKPLDWERFRRRQSVQPLKIIASGLKSEHAVVMDMAGGYFSNLQELTDCMHASCLLPGLAGPVMNLDRSALHRSGQKKLLHGNGLADTGDHRDLEPLADALIFEPLPYHSAVKDGATHVLVIRSRPDGVDVSGKGSLLERLIFRRFFLRKNRLPAVFRRMARQEHKKIYARDILRLNANARSTRDYRDTSDAANNPHLMTMAAPPSDPEVTKLETGREAIFLALRRGFARAYDCLVSDPALRGRGAEVARQVFPDEILDYDPLEIDHPATVSAFETYLRENDINPKAWLEDAGAEAANNVHDMAAGAVAAAATATFETRKEMSVPNL